MAGGATKARPVSGQERGTQWNPWEMMERFGKERGTQLGRLEGKLLEEEWEQRVRARLIRPPPNYTCIKLLAEVLQVMLELYRPVPVRNVSLSPPANLRVLGSINALCLPSEKHIQAGEVRRAYQTLGKEERVKLASVLSLLPAGDQLRVLLETELRRGRLFNLSQLSEVIFALGQSLDFTDEALIALLQRLCKVGPETNYTLPVMAPEDIDHYRQLIDHYRQPAAKHRFLSFGPILGDDHAEVWKGIARLSRMRSDGFVPAPRDFNSPKVLAALYDVLAHLRGAVDEITGSVDSAFQLKCLGALNRSFLVPRHRDALLGHRHEALVDASGMEATELAALKELSIAARHCSISSSRSLASGAKRIQRHILDNRTFNLQELSELFCNLGHQFYVPFDLYSRLMDELVRMAMLGSQDAADAVARVSSDERRQGVSLTRALPRLTLLTAPSGHWIGPRAATQGDPSYRASATAGEDSDRLTQATEQLFAEWVAVSVHEARKDPHVFRTAPYSALAALFETDPPGDASADDCALVIRLTKRALALRAPLGPADLRALIERLPKRPFISPEAVRELLGGLRAARLLPHDLVSLPITAPASPLQLRSALQIYLPTPTKWHVPLR